MLEHEEIELLNETPKDSEDPFTYANIKFHLNLHPLQEEVLDACQTALLLNHYSKEYKARANTSVKRYSNGMQQDILQIYINCIKKSNCISSILRLKIELKSYPKKLNFILEKEI